MYRSHASFFKSFWYIWVSCMSCDVVQICGGTAGQNSYCTSVVKGVIPLPGSADEYEVRQTEVVPVILARRLRLAGGGTKPSLMRREGLSPHDV